MCVGFVVAVVSTLPVDMCRELTFVGVFFSLQRPGCAPDEELPTGSEDAQQCWSDT